MREDFSALPGFTRRAGELYCENIKLTDLAARFGTPLYVYSHEALKTALASWLTGVAGTPHRVFYAMKANSSLALLQFFRRAGVGFDIVSRGELARALLAGAKGSDIVYSGVGKSREDIRAALQAGIGCFNVESIPELDRINEIALEEHCVAPVSVRVNPDVDAKTHPYISTGLKNNKFGVAFDQTVELYKHAKTLAGIRISGIDMHIGSQITQLEPFVHAADKIFDIVEELHRNGIEADIHVIAGSVEIAPGIRLADAIFDIVSSGSTLVSNRLKEVEQVVESEAVLIGSDSLSDEKQEILDELLFRFESVQAADGKKYILMNVPQTRLADVLAVLPGIKSPTVMPLADPAWCSVHTVLDENRFWEMINRLKGAGAEGIVVLDIEKMIL